MPLSHFVPAYPSPSPYPQVHSVVGLCLYSRLALRFFMTFFIPQVYFLKRLFSALREHLLAMIRIQVLCFLLYTYSRSVSIF